MEANQGVITFVSHMFQHGGFWMYPILLVQITTISIIVERIYSLYVLRNVDQELNAAKFDEDIKKGQIEKVIARASALAGSHPALAATVQMGAQAAVNMGGREEIRAKMDEVLLKEQGQLESRTEFLAMFGNAAMLLGLLGTIIGMIRSFASISTADAMTKATLLSGGISEAMNCTAYGLMTAIPALVMYAILQNRANKLSEDLLQGATRVFNLLGYNYEAGPVRKSSGK